MVLRTWLTSSGVFEEQSSEEQSSRGSIFWGAKHFSEQRVQTDKEFLLILVVKPFFFVCLSFYDFQTDTYNNGLQKFFIFYYP